MTDPLRDQCTHAELMAQLDHIIVSMKAHRVVREFEAFPEGHPDRRKRPEFVQEWEAKYGKAPESARKMV